jgi:hypothetical protein
MSYQEAELGSETIWGYRGNPGRGISQRRGRKSRSPGVKVKGGLLGQKISTEPKPLEQTYIISSMGPYQRDDKILLRVAIRGGDNREYIRTAMVDCGVTENFINKEYAEWNWIPLNERMVPRRVLAMDRQEVASGPVTYDAVVKLKINNHHETIKLHCITIGNWPIIVSLPWLKRQTLSNVRLSHCG